MKKIFMLVLILVLGSTYSMCDEYYEVEENSPAYGAGYDCMPDRIARDDNRYSYWNNPVVVVMPDGSRRHTTRKYATMWGWPYREAGMYSGYGYTGVGKRFYPNSNYKREVRVKETKGILTRILEILL